MSSKWSLVDVLPALEDNEVHLWRIELGNATDLITPYTSLLSDDEQILASRRRAGQVRAHFIFGRACLRVLLGNALGIDSSDVSLVKGPHGKPETPPFGSNRVSFNIAHSKDTVLIALGRRGAIGVDVEYIDRATDILEVAKGNFSEDESAALLAIADPDAQRKAFYSYWTRKEAVVKADGRGLLLSLASFDVSSESSDWRRVQVHEPSKDEGKLYFVRDLDIGERAAGALALESSEYRISTMMFPLTSSW